MNILDILFPKKCLECGGSGVYICDTCLKKVPPGRWNEGNYSLFKYEGVIRKAIIKLKYKYATDIAGELVQVCVQKLNTNHHPLVPTLVPIPLHKKRENLRGFNQVELIGKKISEKMNWKFVPNLLKRTRYTTPQVQLKGNERRKNLKNVFEVNKNCVLNTNSKIFLFDDVFTTGSTIKEAKKTLKKAGFKNVRSLTIAG